MTFEKEVVIDGKGHLIGRLASIVAKQLLSGQKVTVVRSEELNVTGSFYRNKLKYQNYLRKRCIINPARGPFHFRAPSRFFYRVIRGMIPHKTARGAAALERLKAFEGCLPQALRVLRLKPGRKYTVIKRISSEMGWKYQGIVEKLEEKRIARGKAFYERKKAIARLGVQAAAKAAKEVAPIQKKLTAFGY
ncbi:ribosomal protein L13 domain-containing protein [Chytridium lagenaria]|nr:ribosomal protein L13 domain-containing protein [Chytridium lagenaria]